MAEYANATFEPRGKPRRIWPWAVAGALLALTGLALAYAVYWYELADAAETAIGDWAKARAAEGMSASHGAITITGFPFSFRIAVDAPALARVQPPQWSWRTDRLTATARPWSPRRVHLEATGNHEIAFRDRGVPRSLDMAASDLGADVMLSESGLVRRIDLTALDLRLDSDQLVGAIGAARFDVSFESAGDTTPSQLSVHARELALPLAGLDAVAPNIARVGGEARVSGVFPPGPIGASVAAWRDGGGAVDLDAVRLEWGPLRIDADGTLALDEELRPIGAFTARVLGLSETVTALTEAEVLSPQRAAIVRITTSILSEETDSGRLEFPVTAQFGKLFVGPVAVLEIPPLVLPANAPPPPDSQ